METKKSRVFTKKLIALFLSVLMALSCFTGALTAFAASVESDKKYYDNNLASNFLAWAETTDEQTAEALLDYADLYIGDLLSGLLGSDHLAFSAANIIKLDGYVDSIDGLLDIVSQAQGILNTASSVSWLVSLGDLKNVSLKPLANLNTTKSGEYVVSKCGTSYRGANSAKEIIMALAQTLYINSNDFAGKNVIGQFVKGKLNMGIIESSVLKKSVYKLLQDTFGMWDGYEADLAYNIVSNLILDKTEWFDEATKADYYAQLKANKRTTFVLDDILFNALNEQFLQEISVLVTYPTMQKDATDKDGNPVSESSYTLAVKNGYKANVVLDNGIVYSDEYVDKNGVPMNVYLFQYDKNGDKTISADEKLTLNQSDNLFSFAFRALEFAWNTVLQDTLGLVHANYDVDRGHGANFDNQFYYWMSQQEDGWNTKDWTDNYDATNVLAWAEDSYAEYGAASAEEFLANVKHTFDYDRSVKEDGVGNWRDVDATTLFAKIRYSPLADIYFDMQTGPINLYFAQTGIDSISSFFATAFDKEKGYSNMVAGLNDALVAATEVIFMDSDNIGYQSIGGTDERKPANELSVPQMEKTGNIDVMTAQGKTKIASTLVSNFMAMFEYAANAADANILNSFYTNNKITTTAGHLTEKNMEEAMIPLLVSCVNQIGMVKPIHDEKWDTVVDAEGAAVIALEEYLSYILPDKDYTSLWTITDGKLVVNPAEINAEKGKTDLFTVAVLPMVRDAVSYLVQSVIPVRDQNGENWDVYSRPVNDDATVFDILNSVIIYYGSTEGYGANTTNVNGVKMNNKGKAVAGLLGAVEDNGKNLVTTSNSVWKNIDAVANKLLPILGVFQFGDKASLGKFDSEKFLYNNIIMGLLDIGVEKSNGLCGITNVIEQIITMACASPITENYGSSSLTVMIYDILADEINTILGARYDGQGYTKLVPNSEYYDRDSYDTTKSSSPFDSLLTVGTLGYYSATKDKDTASGDGKSSGILGILICNIYEMFGGADYATQSAKAGVWTGAMFAVQAVNNFIPSFVPQLSDHFFNAATAVVANPAQYGLTGGSAFSATTIDVTNNSKGVNRFYKDANGNIAQMDRYFMDITDISVTVADTGAAATNINVGSYGKIAPNKTSKISITGTAPATKETYAITVTYDVYGGKEVNGQITEKTAENTIFSGLETTAYFFLTTEVDWQSTVYPSDRIYSEDSSILMFNSTYEKSDNTYVSQASYSDKSLKMYLPKQYIVKLSDVSAVSKNGIRLTGNGSNNIDGLATTLKAGTEYYPVSNGTISDTLATATDQINVAYTAIDRVTGGVVNYNFYDYSLDGGKTYIRKDTRIWGGIGHYGYTESEISDIKDKNPDANFVTRPHVVFTLEEALQSGLVYGVQRTAAGLDESGNVTYVYDAVLFDLASSAATKKYDTPGNNSSCEKDWEALSTILMKDPTSQNSISWGTPTPGLYLRGQKTAPSSDGTYTHFIMYDGTTEITTDRYTFTVCGWRTDAKNSSYPLKNDVEMIICDDSAANSLDTAYNTAVKNVSTYMASDMDDYKDGDSEIYELMQGALADAVTTMGTPIRGDNAESIGSKTETTAVTTWTTSEAHKDLAYKPIPVTTDIPAKVMIDSFKGEDGYWYANKECTLPIYSNVALTDADVTAGKNAVGEDVVKVDGNYYLVNAPIYKTAWDTENYAKPYLATTTEQETTEDGEPYYAEISFVYRDANGDKCTSQDAWKYKLAESHTTNIPNADGVENRGIFQQSSDNMDYYLQLMRGHIKSSVAEMIGKGVKEDREGMNNVNYEVASYEKMVQVAKDAENLIWTEKDEDGKDVYVTDRSSLEVQVAKNMYDKYKSFVVHRDYIDDNTGTKLEKEIVCATREFTEDKNGTTYDKIDVEPIYDEKDELIAYDVTVDGVALDGTNAEGESYTVDSWRYYTWALGNAVTTAKGAHNGSEDVNTNVSNLYTLRTELMSAENNLQIGEPEPPAADEITVSGKVVIADDAEGTDGSFGIGGIDIIANGEVVATTAEDGTFTATVAADVTELTISGPSTVDRIVTLSGSSVADVVIPIVIADYNKDKEVNATDIAEFSGIYGGDYNVNADYNADKEINATDIALFSSFIGQNIVYIDLVLE